MFHAEETLRQGLDHVQKLSGDRRRAARHNWMPGRKQQYLGWYNVGPQTIAKLVNITSITRVYDTYNYS